MEFLLLFISLGLLPIYSFASGGIQPAHVALAGFMLVRLVKSGLKLRGEEGLLLALILVVGAREAYAVTLEAASYQSLLEILYLLFALGLVLAFSRLPMDARNATRTVTLGFALSAAVALIGIWYFGATWTLSEGEISRSVGTFNNPNQLAYFAVGLIAAANLLYLRGQIKASVLAGFLLASGLLAAASLSKAGIIAVAASALLSVAAIAGERRISPRAILVCALLVLTLATAYLLGAFDDFYFVRRIEAIGTDADDTLRGRGYMLPFDAGGMGFLFGVGQQGMLFHLGHEVHSTFWSFFAKYGLIGFALFIVFWFKWSKRIYDELGFAGLILIVIPPTLYGITHNGSRFAILWVLIGLSFGAARALKADRQRRQPYAYVPPYMLLPTGPVHFPTERPQR